MDFAAILRKSAGQFTDRIAISYDARDQTFGQLYERSCRLANGLASLGLGKGDRVATLGDNLHETVEVFGGLALAGAVRCQLYTQNTADGHLYMLNLVGAKALIVQDTYLTELDGRLAEAEALRQVVVIGPDSSEEGVVRYESLVTGAGTEDPMVPIDEDDDFILRFSAGTTGRSKAILHTVRGWYSVGNEFALVAPRLEPDDTFLIAGPLTHAAQLYLWPCLAAGARSVVMPTFEPGQFLELVEREQVTMTFLVPTMIQALTAHPDAAERDVSSLRCVLYGAAPIAERTLVDAQQLWGNIMCQVYGQSEALPISVLTARDHLVADPEKLRERLKSAGRATPNSLIKIVGEDGAELPVGEIGEVAVRSPGAMKEIWGDAEATAARVIDGFVLTRDMGFVDEDGFLYLADRKDDMIISGGYNIWPAEVEDALTGHPAVLEAAVFGAPHEKWGETVFAVVVLREGAQATEDDLISWCRDAIGSVKKPTSVKFSDAPLPKSSVGKLLRRAVRESFWSTADRQIAGA